METTNDQTKVANNRSGMNRRQFLRSSLGASLAAGSALKITPVVFGQGGSDDVINVGLIGAGEQGKKLKNAVLRIPNIRFKAICDIWENYNLRSVVRGLNRRQDYKNSPVNAYTDYQYMLAKEKDLDAVIVATPDFWHAEHAIASLKAGKHVYCEKEMSNALENAKKMVLAARETGKLLQIGHQRRSNPRYIYCYEKLIKEANLLNRITTINGQWNRSRAACEEKKVVRDSLKLDDTVLKKYGYDSMKQFLNWRLYKGKGGGAIVDLGSHQIDIYAWFLDGLPKSVIASGGNDYWKDWEWYDSVMAIFEFDSPQGDVRAFYQTLTSNSSQGYFETFMGDEGTLTISEAAGRGSIYRESGILEDKWLKWVSKGYIKLKEKKKTEPEPQKDDAVMDLRESPSPPEYEIMATLDKPYHQPHLENFFNAVRGKEKLNCPAEIGYETAVMVLKVNQAVQAGKRLEFEKEEFHV